MTTECPSELELAQGIDGELTTNRTDDVATHVAGCAACAATEAALRNVATRLATVPSTAGADPAFLQAVLGRIDRAPVRRGKARGTLAFVVGGVAAAALLVLIVHDRSPPRPTYAARGAELRSQDFTGVEVWIAPVAGQPERHRAEPGETFSARAALSFVVTKGSSARPLHLALFGVDARGEVHWFHPSWSDATRPPSMVALPSEPGATPLPDDVAPEAAAEGPFRVHALFSHVPLDVVTIEAASRAGRLTELATDVRLHTFELRFAGEPR